MQISDKPQNGRLFLENSLRFISNNETKQKKTSSFVLKLPSSARPSLRGGGRAVGFEEGGERKKRRRGAEKKDKDTQGGWQRGP